MVVAVACAVLAAPAGAAAPSPAPPPATLSGESFFEATGNFGVGCATSGPFSFDAAGAAAGPYTGTFSETGTVQVGPLRIGLPATVDSLATSFAVRSPDGTVLVRGTVSQTSPQGVGCRESADTATATSRSSYSATIYTPSGNYHDEGTDLLTVGKGNGNIFLKQQFTSSLLAPALIAPTDKSQCKDGGYRDYPQYKNQGDCTSDLAGGQAGR